MPLALQRSEKIRVVNRRLTGTICRIDYALLAMKIAGNGKTIPATILAKTPPTAATKMINYQTTNGISKSMRLTGTIGLTSSALMASSDATTGITTMAAKRRKVAMATLLSTSLTTSSARVQLV